MLKVKNHLIQYITKRKIALQSSTAGSNTVLYSGKSKATPLQAWTGPEGSRRLSVPRFQDSRQMKVVRLSALHTGRLYAPGNIPGTHFC